MRYPSWRAYHCESSHRSLQMEVLRAKIRSLPADGNRFNHILKLVKSATPAVKWAEVPFAGSVVLGAPVDAYINYFIGMHGLAS